MVGHTLARGYTDWDNLCLLHPRLLAATALDIHLVMVKQRTMASNPAQRKAIQDYRNRLTQRGIARFEVQALETDRELIRNLARRLANGGPEADLTRAVIERIVAGEQPAPGGILKALRRSPLVGADLDLAPVREEGRVIDL